LHLANNGMSEPIKHECGIALIRLLKPPEHYLAKYGTSFYGLKKLHLMMQKQHNRGQDGAGIACVKFDLAPGHKFIDRARSNSGTALTDIFQAVYSRINDISEKDERLLNDSHWLKYHAEFTGELFLGHLRYSTFGKQGIELLHPVLRSNNWETKNLVMAGNFNLTNTDELFERLIDLGQHPIETSDTITMLEKIGHFLDEDNERLYQEFKQAGHYKREISGLIGKNLDIQSILTQSSRDWDGGYSIIGAIGHGDAFALRDPSGIRPAYYYKDDEVVVVASERPVIQTTFNVTYESVREIKPGFALIIKKDGHVSEKLCKTPLERKSCSFERIYFSRGTDFEIYRERQKLGKALTPAILDAIDNDLENTVFSYIPNTASVAFQGLIDELENVCARIKKEKILLLGKSLTPEKLEQILSIRPRVEQVAVKDAKLRTFITQDKDRDDLVGHIYDITYGSIKKGIDNLVVLDDSIVRGTTLKQSIIRILDRLQPKKIVVASSAPQIRYPDCYGIDMSKLHDFIAFHAAISLLKETRQGHIINEVYKKCMAQANSPREAVTNQVKEIYKPFSAEQISAKIAAMLTTADTKSVIQVVYQKIEDLHEACPDHKGDWYFTGNYPTPGGNKVVNKAFINYIEGRDVRPY
jgi:amidophosphoribosyltransferase